MTGVGERGDRSRCSFCGKGRQRVQRLIVGPGVYICDQCVELCCEILDEEDPLNPYSSHSSNPELYLRAWIKQMKTQDSTRIREIKQLLEQLADQLDEVLQSSP